MGLPSGSRAGSRISSLFGNQHGLLVLEVKDWLIDQIEEADFNTNPDKQARGYVSVRGSFNSKAAPGTITRRWVRSLSGIIPKLLGSDHANGLKTFSSIMFGLFKTKLLDNFLWTQYSIYAIFS